MELFYCTYVQRKHHFHYLTYTHMYINMYVGLFIFMHHLDHEVVVSLEYNIIVL